MSSSSAATFELPLERRQDFKDADGNLSYSKRENDIMQRTLGFTSWLATSETVSTATYDASGVTISGTSVSSPNVIFTVTGIGEVDITVTSSNSRVKVVKVRFYDVDGARALDYQL